MKLTLILSNILVFLVFTAIFALGMHVLISATDSIITNIIMFIWMLLTALVIPFIIYIKLEKKFNSDLRKVKEEYLRKGAESFLHQVSSTERFNEVTNKTLPIINAKGETIGSTSVYGDLRDFLNKEYKTGEIS
jgi:Na+-driven multidrug efflux pump